MRLSPSFVAIFATLLALAVLAPPAAAQDLTSTEKRFLKALATGLGDESREMAAAPGRSDPNRVANEVALGRALAFLGEPAGIPLLIRNLDPGEIEKWAARQAGESLNALTGLAVWTAGGNPRAARDAYTEWWEANRDRLVFDPAMRRYEVRR